MCMPGMDVILWGESPLYMNPAPSFYDGSESTSRRQGHHREVSSKEGGVQSCETTCLRADAQAGPLAMKYRGCGGEPPPGYLIRRSEYATSSEPC